MIRSVRHGIEIQRDILIGRDIEGRQSLHVRGARSEGADGVRTDPYRDRSPLGTVETFQSARFLKRFFQNTDDRRRAEQTHQQRDEKSRKTLEEHPAEILQVFQKTFYRPAFLFF